MRPTANLPGMRLVLPLLLLFLASACRSVPRSQGCFYVEQGHGPAGKVSVRAEVVAQGLEIPWSLAFLPGGDLLITERAGRLRLLKDGALVPQPVATLQVESGGEGGLQGLALHPDFGQNRQLFLYFTVQKEGRQVNRLERWILAQDHRSARFDARLLDDLPAARIHHGGRLRVGPDRMLYLSVGDAGEGRLAQDPQSLAGKLLRVDLEGAPPGDNPVAGSPIFLSGIRNSQGFDWWDERTLLVADHGPSGERGRFGNDRVSLARAGENLGWPEIFGCEVRGGFAPPIIAWRAATPPGGAAIYRGEAIPGWKDSLLIATLGSRHLQRVKLDSTGKRVELHEVYFQGDPPAGHGRLREVVIGPDGHLYATTSNCDGRGTCPPSGDVVLRIVPGE